jgi:hypothetical protein
MSLIIEKFLNLLVAIYMLVIPVCPLVGSMQILIWI